MNKLFLAATLFLALNCQQAIAVIPLITPIGSTDLIPDIGTITNQSNGLYESYLIIDRDIGLSQLEAKLNSVCTGTVYKYTDTNATSPVYLCDKSAAITAVVQPYLAIHVRLAANSLITVRSSQQPYITIPSLATATSCTLPNINSISSCTGGTRLAKQIVPQANLATMEAKQFIFFGTPAPSGYKVCGTQTAGLVVTKKLRDAMQAAMIQAGAIPGCTVGDETEACMPNLTTAQITTIFAQGHSTSWDDFRYDKLDPGPSGLPHSIYGVATTFPTTPTIHICSRTAGSGILGLLNIKFENAPCNGSVNEAIQPSSAASIQQEPANTSRGKFYHSNSTSADVENCLTALDTGSAAGSFNFISAVGNGAAEPVANRHRWAIGILPANLNINNAKPYRYIKIDNSSPTSPNVVKGRYKFWYEYGQVGAAPTDPIAASFLSSVCTPDAMAAACVAQTWGIVCPLGNACSSDVPTFDAPLVPGTLVSAGFERIRPVNPYTHATGSCADVNHCRKPSIPNGRRSMPVFY